MDEDKNFLRQDNNYRSLKAFQKAECIYDVTFYFAHKFLKTGDQRQSCFASRTAA